MKCRDSMCMHAAILLPFFIRNSKLLLLLFLLSLLTLKTTSLISATDVSTNNHTQKYFYIYDWPKKLRDVYPPAGALLHNTSSYHHDFGENGGFGKTINKAQGVFATWQFSLFKNIMARLRVSEYRTLDSKEASAFIIPYDMGVNSFIGE